MFRATNNTLIAAPSVVVGITAFATGGQASATALTGDVNRVATVATAADSVKLPAAKQGASIFVKNRAANALAVFPATGETIDNGAANAVFSVPAAKGCIFVASADGAWETILGA